MNRPDESLVEPEASQAPEADQAKVETLPAPPMKPRGFAALTPERRIAIAKLGGRAAHAVGRAHKYTSEEASVAGRKGGQVVAARAGHMAEIGRKGGQARGRNILERAAKAGEP